jgi:hypothetical protein
MTTRKYCDDNNDDNNDVGQQGHRREKPLSDKMRDEGRKKKNEIQLRLTRKTVKSRRSERVKINND